MKVLRSVMYAQAFALLAYGLPYLLAPAWTQSVTGQLAVAEPYFLRALGILFFVLGVAELLAARAMPQTERLAWAFFLSAVLFTGTIAVQLALGGLTGATWYWWLNLVVSAVFVLLHLIARRRG